MSDYVYTNVPLLPRDRAALARAAHARNRSTAEFIRELVIEWLNTENLRTVPIPEIPAAVKRSTPRKRPVKVAANQNRFDVT